MGLINNMNIEKRKKLNDILEEILPKTFPLELIDIISDLTIEKCKCELVECNFCKKDFKKCDIILCANCKKKSCGLNYCPNSSISFALLYDNNHSRLNCCSFCSFCQNK